MLKQKGLMIMFFLVFFLIYFIGNVYIIFRIARDLNLHGLSFYIFFAVYIAAAVFSFWAMKFSRENSASEFAAVISKAGYIWLGVFSISIAYFLLSHILFIFNHSQKFMFNTTLVTIILIVISSVYSVINTCGVPRVKEVEINVKHLPVDKFTIVQLSDIHIDVSTKYDDIKKIVDITNSLNPDIIAFTGDLADINIAKTYKEYGLADLKAKYGVVAINGNHEYYTGVGLYEYVCNSLDWKLLNNENILIDDKFYFAGITDIKTSTYFNNKKADVDKAMNGINFEKPVIFMSHQPQIFSEVYKKYPITLQLSGHTHAGQIPPFDMIEYFIYKYFWGLYKENYNGKESYIYVTPGTRWWGPPMRLISKNEITKITLRR
ncbi:MAG: metallophosphoesterase [Elusimicrobia bacterium]|nr:metallophosphoesterase [Elusimicrobiota bacterium]